MSPFGTVPHVTPGVTLRLTKNSLPPRVGVGQKSSEDELIGAGRFSGAPQGASFAARCATQMSIPPWPPSLVDAKYRLIPSGDWIGHPSWAAGSFSSELVPGTLSALTAVPHGEKSSACADGAKNAAATSATTTLLSGNMLAP